MAISFSNLEAQLANIDTTINGYLTTLINDTANPLMTYSFRGQTLNRNEWRQGLVDAIRELEQLKIMIQEMENQVNPTIIRTRHIVP